jgi:hypothetical protein
MALVDELLFTCEYAAGWSAQLNGYADEAERRFERAKAVAGTIEPERLPVLIARCRSRLEEAAGVTLPGSFG